MTTNSKIAPPPCVVPKIGCLDVTKGLAQCVKTCVYADPQLGNVIGGEPSGKGGARSVSISKPSSKKSV